MLSGIPNQDFFGGIGEAGHARFRIMPPRPWLTGIMRPAMEPDPNGRVSIMPSIAVTTDAAMTLLVASIVTTMQDAQAEKSAADTDALRDAMLKRLAAIERLLAGRSHAPEA